MVLGSLAPGAERTSFGILIVLLLSICGRFLTCLVPVLAAELLGFFAFGFGRLGESSIEATSSSVNL